MPTYIYQLGSDSYTLGVYYTPTVEYFGHEHLPYALLALTLLALFVLIPLLTLLLYFFRSSFPFFLLAGTFFEPSLTRIKAVSRMEQNLEHSTVDGFCTNVVSTNIVPCLWINEISNVLYICYDHCSGLYDNINQHSTI